MSKDLHRSSNISSMDMDYLDWFDKMARNLALLAAAYIGYLRYVKGRGYKVRLQPTISCTVLGESETQQLLVSAEIKNIGLIGASIPEIGYAIEILTPAKIRDDIIQDVKWESAACFFVFAYHNSIEVGESVKEELLLSVPKGHHNSLKLRLRGTYDGHKWLLAPRDKGSDWEAITIVPCDAKEDNKSRSAS